MKISTGSAGARIIGVGEHRPARLVTNAEICANIDSSDEWIRERSGIVTRRYAAPDESVVDMATSAASKAVAASGVEPDDIDLVLLATCSHPFQTPGGSSQVQDRLGAPRAGAMDINAACAGFSYALSVAADAVRAGSARHVVVVGAEKMTDFIDPHDRGMAFLFGDGAGAVVVAASDDPG
ncbi:MAG: 3-oxoacyl-ACP synthase, partial [Acidothermaceae bacterium]